MPTVGHCKKRADGSGVVTHGNTKIARDRPRTAPAKTLVNADQEKGVCSEVDEWEEEDEEQDQEDIFFEETFLDSDYKIKDDVHEKLKRFLKTWLCYEYGIMAPDEKIPRTHIYLTVKNGVKKSEVFQDLKESFNCEPTKYFDIRDEPKPTPKCKFLTRPTSGGGILAKEDIGRNQPPEQDDFEFCPSGSLGTLTMFCFKHNNHYALTCFHVGCQNDNERYKEAFNAKSILSIRKSQSNEWSKTYASTKKYYYRSRQNPDADDIELGRYHRGIFDQYCDIMTIKVAGDVQIECKVAEMISHSWGRVKRLRTRYYSKKRSDPIKVRKVGYSSNETFGCIENLSCEILCVDDDDNNVVLFRDAIKVKNFDSNSPFLEAGDSGALVSFSDSEGRQQPFAYAVCEREPFFYCLKLDKALKELHLWDAGYFDTCARDNGD